jgi:hypothetical protein
VNEEPVFVKKNCYFYLICRYFESGAKKRKFIFHIYGFIGTKVKMDLLELGVSVVDWIGLAQDRYRWRALLNSIMNFRDP